MYLKQPYCHSTATHAKVTPEGSFWHLWHNCLKKRLDGTMKCSAIGCSSSCWQQTLTGIMLKTLQCTVQSLNRMWASDQRDGHPVAYMWRPAQQKWFCDGHKNFCDDHKIILWIFTYKNILLQLQNNFVSTVLWLLQKIFVTITKLFCEYLLTKCFVTVTKLFCKRYFVTVTKAFCDSHKMLL